MILPTTYATALLLTILAMLCWGSWASTFKLTRKWRFELFYFDYAFGVLLTAVIAAFTFGSMGEELTFEDNLLIAGKRQMATAMAAGGVFNLANMLLVAAISLSGMAVAFPVGLGFAFVVGLIWNYVLHPGGSALFLLGGAAIVMCAVVVAALAYRAHGSNLGKFSAKALVLSVVSGLLMGSFYPLVEMSRATEIGLGAYAAVVMFAIGMLLTTFVLNLYFMNLPVQGDPVPITDYLRGSRANHLWGLVGGVIWCIGAICSLTATSAPTDVNLTPFVSHALDQGATLIAALWGLVVWKEFAGATGRVKMLLTLMIVLFIAALGLISMAPVDGS